MEENFDEDPLNDLLIPEISMNIDDAAVELNEEPNKSNPLEEHNGEDVVAVEPGNEVVQIVHDVSDDLNHAGDANQENENPAQIPEVYTLEEVAVYEQIFGPGRQAVEYLRMHCTACNEHLGSAPSGQHRRYIHPLLKVLICKRCFDFYGSGDFDKDEDGSELYCRWCGQGGKVLCCAQCAYVFCQRCIRTNLGKKALEVVKESDDWTCFACKPLQIINLRVTCRALYDYIQQEIRLAAELKQPERLNVDNSLCCHGKTKVVVQKRKHSDCTEVVPYDPLALDNEDVYRKKKKMKQNILAHMLAPTNVNSATKIPAIMEDPKSWESNVQDEVVCTPDLPMLMDDDDTSVHTPTASPQPSCSTSQSLLPPLRPISPFANGVSKKDTDVQYVGQTRVLSGYQSGKPVQPKTNFTKPNLGYTLPNIPLLLNTAIKKPVTAAANSGTKNISPNFICLQTAGVRYTGKNKQIRQPIVTVAHNHNNSVIDATPARLVPGLRYEWFDKAAQVTARVNQNLSTKLCTLSNEQNTVTSLEGLASIHNNLQEILSNSINSLMQIRKNLRSDFITGLKKLKFCKTEENTSQSQQIPEDNDVVFVEPNTSNTPSVPNPVNTSNEVRPRGYIKVKPVSELLDSAVITIPDDISLNENAVIPFINNSPVKATNIAGNKGSLLVTNGCNVKAQNDKSPDKAQSSPSPKESVSDTEIPEALNPETVSLIKRAMLESKFEAIVNDNSKLHAEDISPTLFKSMLTVRVVVETNFGSSTPRTKPRKGYKAMNVRKIEEDDIEQLLSSSIVVNTSKRKAFDDSFSAFVASRSYSETNEDCSASESHTSNDDNDNSEDKAPEPEAVTKQDDQLEANLKETGLDMVSENEIEEPSHDPRTTDSGIDVDGEQSLSNGDKNYQDND